MPVIPRLDFVCAVEFLRSLKVAKELLEKGKIQRFRHEDVQLLYPEKYGIGIEDGVDNLRDSLKFDVYEIYRYLGKELFTRERGLIVLRSDKLELFHYLATSLDYFPVTVLQSIDDIFFLPEEEKIPFMRRISEVEVEVEGTLKNRISTISDLHVHLGGALKFPFRLYDIFTNPSTVNLNRLPLELGVKFTEKEFPLVITTAFLFETFVSGLILHEGRPAEKEWRKKLIEASDAFVSSSYNRSRWLYEQTKRKSIRLSLRENFSSSIEGEVVKLANREFLNRNFLLGDRLLTFALILFSLKNSFCRPYVQAYFVLRNIIKRAVVQQHRRSDFSYFSSYSRSSLRRAKKKEEFSYIARCFHRAFPEASINIEGRIVPSASPQRIAERITEIVSEFEKVQSEIEKDYRHKKLNLKFVFHFIKEKDKLPTGEEDESVLFLQRVRWKDLREKIREQTFAIRDFMKYYSSVPLNSTKEEKVSEVVRKVSRLKGAELFHGIDAASKEYYTPPEVFAPVYTYFKRTPILSHKLYSFPNSSNFPPEFCFTYHVGEEFRDILSGLRSIFEAVIFLNLSEGDRIGHGVALRMSPEVFIRERRKDTPISKQEALDNFTFLYFLLRRTDKEVPKKYETVEKLEEVVNHLLQELSKKSYEDNIGITIDDYIDSWFLRRNCPLEFKKLLSVAREEGWVEGSNFLQIIDSFLEDVRKFPHKYLQFGEKNYLVSSLPDIFEDYLHLPQPHERYLKASRNPKAFYLYLMYNIDYSWKKRGKEFFNKNLEIPFEVIETVQEILEDLLIDRGIVVEVPLASNLMITPIAKVKEHPVFKLIKPLSERKLKIVLGSDNPGIQETSIAFEVHLLYSALKEVYGEKTALEYVTEVINEGNIIFGG